MIIDVHTHVGFNAKRAFNGIHPFCQSAQDLVRKMDQFGIDTAVTFPFEPTLYDDPKDYYTLIPTGLMEYPYQYENRLLIDQVKKFGKDRLIPFACVDPLREVDKQAAQLRAWAEEGLIRGFKIHTKSMQADGRTMINSPFAAIAEEFKLSMLFHTYMQEVAHPLHVMEFVKNHSSIHVCIAHGGGFIQEFYDELEKVNPQNFFIDLSPTTALLTFIRKESKERGFTVLDLPYENPQEVVQQMVKNYGEYIVFGTDEPFTTYINDLEGGSIISDMGKELEIFRSLSTEDFEKVTDSNPRRFLHL